MLERIIEGRTDLVFDYVAQGQAATSKDRHGTSLISWRLGTKAARVASSAVILVSHKIVRFPNHLGSLSCICQIIAWSGLASEWLLFEVAWASRSSAVFSARSHS